MYIDRPQWSQPEGNDPPPCFRQGDVVSLTWVRPDVTVSAEGIRLAAIELRTEPVALLSADCDLVHRFPLKRKGVLVSPLRSVPRNIAKNAAALEVLRAASTRPPEAGSSLPANLFYFAPIESAQEGERPISENVIHLEVLSTVSFELLARSHKLAEVTEGARLQLQERLKWHFTRTEAPL